MFERFTDRSRKIMALANRQALRRGHDAIDAPHILLGMIEEGSGVGVAMLKDLGVNLASVPAEIDKHFENGTKANELGKLLQTAGAKRVIESAILESRAVGHNYVGSEHLLLGLLRENDGLAAGVLSNLGITLQAAREALRKIHGMP